MTLCLVSAMEARQFIEAFHYSKVMPRLTKVIYGFRIDGALMGVMTLGWGVRPLHTIAKAFPGCTPADYFEIGKMCLHEVMPRNSESQFIAAVVKRLRRDFPGVKLLYTWADGLVGKPGYVYQAANFYYGGFIWSETYLNAEGIKVHPRTIQGLSDTASSGRMKSRSKAVTTRLGYTKYWGKQFRYVYPLCNKREWSRLERSSPFIWTRSAYPKAVDLEWQVDTSDGRQRLAEIPFTRGAYIRNDKELSLCFD